MRLVVLALCVGCAVAHSPHCTAVSLWHAQAVCSAESTDVPPCVEQVAAQGQPLDPGSVGVWEAAFTGLVTIVGSLALAGVL